MSEPTGGPPKGQLRPPLRLVRLLGETPKPHKYTRRGYIFTDAQEAWMRTALRNARAAFGTWACLADAMGIGKGALADAVNNRNHISPEMVIRFAAATGMSVDVLLHPSIAATDQCPSCGATRGGST
jgi:hypothetical protein